MAQLIGTVRGARVERYENSFIYERKITEVLVRGPRTAWMVSFLPTEDSGADFSDITFYEWVPSRAAAETIIVDWMARLPTKDPDATAVSHAFVGECAGKKLGIVGTASMQDGRWFATLELLAGGLRHVGQAVTH